MLFLKQVRNTRVRQILLCKINLNKCCTYYDYISSILYYIFNSKHIRLYMIKLPFVYLDNCK